MPEKTKNLTVVKRDVNRNTSNQIISYGLPKSKEEEYGSVRLISAATFYEKESYKKVMGVVSDELINNNGELEITEQKLNYIKYKAISAEIVSELEEFVDEFSARYELPPNDKKFYSYNQSYESATRPYGSTNLGFSKVVFGPPQATPGRYTITKELIDSGKDLKLTYQIRSFDKREVERPNALSDRSAANYLDRYPDLRRAFGYRNSNGEYTAETLNKAKAHWVGYGNNTNYNENRFIWFPVSIDTRFQRIRKSSAETSINSFGIRNTVTEDIGPNALRPDKNNGFNHVNGITILNEDMKEFDEWQIAGSCGTWNNDEVGYYVDSSFWDIQLISN